MRTTLTLEDDVARELTDAVRRTGRSLKDVVNDALRRGLRLGAKPEPRPAPFVVETFSSPFQPGVDPGRLNQLLDDLEVEGFLSKVERERTRK